MKNFFRLSIFTLTGLFLIGCGAYKSKNQTAALNLPELGSIVQTKGRLWHTVTEQVGNPNWETPLILTVRQLPFNKISYNQYAEHVSKKGGINNITYIDSVLSKPKYLRLQLLDKISLSQRLNTPSNKTVRSYIENDVDYKIVTALNLTLSDMILTKILDANTVLMQNDTETGSHLVLIKGKQEQKISFSELQVFEYEFSSFCWSEDRYHNKVIATILPFGESCPKGTYSKAAKVHSEKSYLKF